MIITIQPLKKGYAISLIDTYIFPNMNQHEVVQEADKLSDLVFYSKTEPRPVIKWLPIQHTPMKTKKKKIVAKKKKAVKKAVKK